MKIITLSQPETVPPERPSGKSSDLSSLGGCPKMGFPENRVLKINNLEHKNSRKSYSRTAS